MACDYFREAFEKGVGKIRNGQKMLMIFFEESLELTEKNALFMIASLVGARSLGS